MKLNNEKLLEKFDEKCAQIQTEINQNTKELEKIANQINKSKRQMKQVMNEKKEMKSELDAQVNELLREWKMNKYEEDFICMISSIDFHCRENNSQNKTKTKKRL